MNWTRARSNAVCLVIVFLAASTSSVLAEHWPRFRGPDGNGIAEEVRLPERWSAKENVQWVSDIPGRGWSSPIVWGRRVFVTSAIEEGDSSEPPKGMSLTVPRSDLRLPDDLSMPVRWMVYCLDAESGRILWEREAHRGPPPGGRHIKNTYASATPVTDGERVYAYFGNVGLFVYSMEGEPVWSFRVEPREMFFQVGTGSSPTFYDRRVFLLHDNQVDSFLVALDAQTGRELWRVKRDFPGQKIRSTWTTPYVWSHERRTELVALGPGAVVSYSLEGEELWRFGSANGDVAASPTSLGNLLLVTSGSPTEDDRPVFAIRAGASGNISLANGERSNAFVSWYHRLGGAYVPSPVAYGDNLYVLGDSGILAAYDLETGKRKFRARLGEGLSGFSSSPWLADGKIYFLSEDGDTFIIRAGDRFELLRKNSLDEMCMATPAISGGSLFIRTLTRLYRISDR